MEVFGDLRNGIKGQKKPCVFLGPFVSSAKTIISIMCYAKSRLGICYLRKSVFLILLNNKIAACWAIIHCLKRKN